MSKYSDVERQGLIEFFDYNETNRKILISIAKTISKMKEMTPKGKKFIRIFSLKFKKKIFVNRCVRSRFGAFKWRS